MSVPEQAVVREVLSRNDRERKIHEAASGGWIDYQNSSEAGHWRRKGTRAAIVWERMVDRAIAGFLDDQGVVPIEVNDSVHFLIDDTVVFRFKKGDSGRLSRNYPTQTALSLHRHEENVPGLIADHHRVEVIYVLNDRETDISVVSIVARQENSILWHYDMGDFSTNIYPLPLIPTAPRPTTNLVRVKEERTMPDKRDGEK